MTYLPPGHLSPIADTWTEEEKTVRIRRVFHGRKLFIPDDDFYIGADDDEALYGQLLRIQRHLGIKGVTPGVRFFDDMETDGNLIMDDAPEILISNKYRHDTYRCAAIIAHEFCHFALMKKRLYLSETAENEKLADLMSIETGLGLVVLNGISSPGWSGVVRRRALGLFGRHVRGAGLGYFNSGMYVRHFLAYLEERRLPVANVNASIVPWVRSITPRLRSPSSDSVPAFAAKAEQIHMKSLRHFVTTCFILIVSLLFGVNIALRHPAFYSPELRIQKDHVERLNRSYEACIGRVEELRGHRDADDHFMKRIIEAEITTCKSLQNRYNHEVKTYNALLQRHD